MQRVNAIPKRLQWELNNALFALSPEGVLVYQDPMIGALANPEKQLAVVVNLKKACLELKVREEVKQRFDLRVGTRQACREAFHAYFTAFESLVVIERQAVKAA